MRSRYVSLDVADVLLSLCVLRCALSKSYASPCVAMYSYACTSRRSQHRYCSVSHGSLSLLFRAFVFVASALCLMHRYRCCCLCRYGCDHATVGMCRRRSCYASRSRGAPMAHRHGEDHHVHRCGAGRRRGLIMDCMSACRWACVVCRWACAAYR